MSISNVIGIDLGTTYSAVAYINEHGKAEILPNREGDRTTPSVVLFDGDTSVVGILAKQSAVAQKFNVCQFVKRQMGEENWRFVTENDRQYTSEEVSALILRRLKEDAEAALNCEINDAVITVPAYFNDAQRKSTQDAGRIAGLNVLGVINEPTAAALSYGLDHGQDQTIMVYDLGGGTFDVTIMRSSKGEIEVIATGGDKNLGGFEWDNALMNFLNDKFQMEGGRDLCADSSCEQDLRDKAENAKRHLSSRDSTKVFLSAEGKHVSVPVLRDDFERITAHLIDRTQSLTEMTLEDAKLTWSHIDKVLLVGGSTRMKAVTSLIERISGKKPSAELHPDEVVAEGAALYAGLVRRASDKGSSSRLDGIPDVKISDVNSHSLGTLALNGQTGELSNSIILPKNTSIPTRMSRVYNTVDDNQTRILIRVTEGEDIDPEYVRILGEGLIAIPPYPKGAQVEVFFQYDNCGIIHVTVVDLTANQSLGELHIQRKSNLTDAEVQRKMSHIASIDVQ